MQTLINSQNEDTRLLLESLNKRIEHAESESQKLKELIQFVLEEESGDLNFIKWKIEKELSNILL